MAYQTGSATDIEDLVDKLCIFAAALSTTPWTVDEKDLTANYATLHYTDGGAGQNCFVSFRWDATTKTDLALFQSLGWSGPGVTPENHTDDAGGGDTSVPINTGRRVNFASAGPFTAYHFFAGEGDTPYIHVVVEVDSGRYRHFGFGNLIKHGTWTGGEYVYGHFWSTVNKDTPTYISHSFMFDCIYAGTTDGSSLHIEDMDDQTVDEKWAMFSHRSGAAGVDTAGEDRKTVVGGSRGGFWGRYLAWMRYSSPNVYVPMMPIPVVYLDMAAAPDTIKWLGTVADISVINMHPYVGGQEITVGAETWIVFPWVRKQYLLDNTEESWNGGLAYRQETA